MAYRLSPEAREDIAEIGTYLVGVGGRAAISTFLARIKGCVSLLGRQPCIGRARDDELGPGRRSLVCGRHVRIHRTEGRVAVILRIIDGRRDDPALLREP